MNGTSTATVHVVDDDSGFLAAFGRLMRATGHAVSTFRSATQFLAECTAESNGCVVTDLRMPGLDGLGLQSRLGNDDRAMPIVFVTGQGDVPCAVMAMRQGAVDFLAKTSPKEIMLGAVDRAMALDQQNRQRKKRQREIEALLARLTPRESEVLSFVVRGMLNKQIAFELGIHERTVKLHRTSITTKLRVQSVAELAVLVHEARSNTFPKG